MKRLTEKVKNIDDYIKLPTIDKQEFINKLGELEDLEEELGCPLEVAFKALKNGFYDKYGNWYKTETDKFNLNYDWPLSNPNDKYLIFDIEDTYDYFKLADYKKTWWLKEDRSE